MSYRILNAVILALSVFIVLIVGSELAGESVEFSMGVDGLRRSSIGCVLKDHDYSFGAAYLRVPEGYDLWMVGVNSSLLSLGHLSDAGLASEVRCPGVEALGRAAERTFYRADLRSVSRSRFGIAVMPWDARTGVAWERRDGLDAGVVWMTLAKTDFIEWELLGEAVEIKESQTDEAWYPDEPGSSASSLGIAATRWRVHSRDWSLALSVLSSCGSAWRPGGLLSLSTGLVAGPWYFYSRSVCATQYFRDADGNRSDFLAATKIQWRRRPSHGLRFGAEYEAGVQYLYPVGRCFVDEGVLSIGWKSQHVQIDAVTDWNRVASISPLTDEECAFRRASFSVRWDVGHLCIQEDLSIDAQTAWKASTSLKYSGTGPFSTTLKCTLHSTEEVLLWDIGMKNSFRFGLQKIETGLVMKDLPRDWTKGEPSGAGDFQLDIRWTSEFR